MNVTQVSIAALSGGQSSKVGASTTSAQSATIATSTAAGQKGDPVKVVITCDAAVFMRYDPAGNPTAVADGTDQYLAANVPYRTEVVGGGKFAFITGTGTANVYITPGA